MAATQLKVAYAIFISSFGTWIVFALLPFFLKAEFTSPQQFPSFTVLAVLLVSAVVSSTTCLIIGLSYLGLKTRSNKRTPTIEKTKSIVFNAEAAKANTTHPGKASGSAVLQPKETECLQTLLMAPEEGQEAVITKKKRELKR